MTVSRLRELLDRHHPDSIVDVRMPEEEAVWHAITHVEEGDSTYEQDGESGHVLLYLSTKPVMC